MIVTIETKQDEDGTWSFRAVSDTGMVLAEGNGFSTEQDAYDFGVMLA